MSLPIGQTPILRGKDAVKFLKMIDDGLKHPCGLVPTPKLEALIKSIIADKKLIAEIKNIKKNGGKIYKQQLKDRNEWMKNYKKSKS